MSVRRRAGALDTLVGQAIDALLQHRLRTTLAAVGLVCGVAGVVASFAITEGARQAALREFGALGATNVFIRDTGDAGLAPVLTDRDIARVRATVPAIEAGAATRLTATEASWRGGHAPVSLAGVTAEWPRLVGASPRLGRWWPATDAPTTRRVAVVGSEVSAELFGAQPAIGERVLCAGEWYTVIGILPPRAVASRASLFDLDHAIIVPFDAMDSTQGRGDGPGRARELAFQLSDAGDVERAVPVMASLIARQYGPTSPVTLVVPRELLRARLAARRTSAWVLLGVGGLSLLISGIGIMNIMLASVTERAHEIGVRRAVGARRPDIVAQFACEAAVLCLAGGMAGVPVGSALAWGLSWAGGWPCSITLTAVAVSLGAATATGLTFGIYPARVAARVNPIDALRL
jgi:putative ABC transport system permease protein